MPSQNPIRIAVIGAGSFGRNHLRVYRELQASGAVTLAAAVDSNPAVTSTIAAEYGIPTFNSIEDFLAAGLGVTAASLCVPTVHHSRLGCQLLAAGLDLLVEKPIASSLAEADALIAAAAAGGRILQVGHLERFNPAVTAALPLLHRPMFFEAHRLSIFTPRSLDVDVVLDLMIHDLDIVLSFVPSEVVEIRAVGLPVLSPKTDIANVRLEFANGCVANFTASRVSTERVRKLRFFQPQQYFSIDFAHRELLYIDVSASAALTPTQLALLAAATPGTHPSMGLALSKVPVEAKEPLILELESFVDSVRHRTPPCVTGHAARAALAVAFQINNAIAAHAAKTGITHS
ncbi:MAG: Gfo/Idh/MocA family oxidoreductase [Acidobacteriaceae bacterium]|nr:Gfo/Idh/MocA family oxidoreductase [Acidobacteriaceae bacterium]